MTFYRLTNKMASFSFSVLFITCIFIIRMTVVHGYNYARDASISNKNSVSSANPTDKCPTKCECQYNGNDHLNLLCDVGYSDENLTAYFVAHPRISRVTFQSSNLTTIPASLCSLPDLSELNLADNQIASIPNYNSCFWNIAELDLAHNMLTRLNTSTFEGFRLLNIIHLEYNAITYIDRMAFLHPDLQRLTAIHLQNNLLEYADTWMFRLPRFLNGYKPYVGVNLSCNQIHSLGNTFHVRASDVHQNQSLGIDFRKNQIRSVATIRSVFQIEKAEDAKGMLYSGFRFQYNPFDCDCDMFMFLNFTRSLLPFFFEGNMFWRNRFISIHCQTPPAAQGKLIYNVSDDVFRCYVNDSCPQGAECIHTPGNKTMTVRNKDPDVTSLPVAVPEETYIQIIYPYTRIHTLSDREYLRNVTTIDLSNTQLSNITDAAAGQLMAQVRHINFRESKLKFLPEAFTSTTAPYLQSVNLAGNPFQCDCHMPQMREWLLYNTSAIIDLNLITCANIPFHGKTITTIPAKYMICGYIYIFSVGSVFLLLILVFIFLFTFFALKRRIMMRLVKFFDKNFTLGSNPTARMLKYHITIFVAEEDQDRVDNICMAIEDSDDNLTVHRLGYLIGSRKLDITDKLPQSEGCLFFLSSEAVQDNHCIFCFRFAVDQFIRHYHGMFLIPVLLDSKETLIRNSKIPKDTKLFLQLFDSVDMSDDNHNKFPRLFDEMKNIMKKQVVGFPHTLTTDDSTEIIDNNGTNLELNTINATNATEDNVDTYL